jgi:hypothetical protein
MVVLDYFRRLGHDNHRRLCKVYGWEEKKTKTSCGAETVDYEKIAAAAVEAMTAADLHSFLVVCALVSDLYCPGYDPKQALAKDSNLARTAARYRIDATRVTAAVRAELLRTTKKPQNGTKTDEKAANSTTQQRGTTKKQSN